MWYNKIIKFSLCKECLNCRVKQFCFFKWVELIRVIEFYLKLKISSLIFSVKTKTKRKRKMKNFDGFRFVTFIIVILRFNGVISHDVDRKVKLLFDGNKIKFEISPQLSQNFTWLGCYLQVMCLNGGFSSYVNFHAFSKYMWRLFSDKKVFSSFVAM